MRERERDTEVIGNLTDSAAGLEGATLFTLATGASGHVVSPSVGTAKPLGIDRVSVTAEWAISVEVDGAAKAAWSAPGNRSSTVLLSVASRARADRAWRIEYYHQP